MGNNLWSLQIQKTIKIWVKGCCTREDHSLRKQADHLIRLRKVKSKGQVVEVFPGTKSWGLGAWNTRNIQDFEPQWIRLWKVRDLHALSLMWQKPHPRETSAGDPPVHYRREPRDLGCSYLAVKAGEHFQCRYNNGWVGILGEPRQLPF